MFQSEKCFLLSKHAVCPIKPMSYLGLPAECDVLMFEFFVGARILGERKLQEEVWAWTSFLSCSRKDHEKDTGGVWDPVTQGSVQRPTETLFKKSPETGKHKCVGLVFWWFGGAEG